MNQRIVYPNNTGGISIIIPTEECGLSVTDIARKDVPKDTPYIIINNSDIPSDRTFRAAWDADFSEPDGYGIGADAWFAEQATKGE